MNSVLPEPRVGNIPRFEQLCSSATPPTGIACITAKEMIARNEFLQRVDALAAQLIRSKRPALLACSDTGNFSIAFCALLRAGREILLPPNLQPETLSDPMFSRAECIDDSTFSKAIPQGHLPPADFDAAHPVSLFTSGSTGKPKRVDKTLRQLAIEIETLEAQFGHLLNGASVHASVPHIHLYGMLFRVLWPLAAARAFHSETVIASPAGAFQKQVLVSSPALLRRIPADMLSAGAPRIIFSSGGRLPEDEAAGIAKAAGCSLIEVYGSTETGGIAWREWPADGTSRDGCWTPFADVKTKISGDDNRLAVHSGATNNKWCDTGDAVTVRNEGRFLLDGRVDGIIKIEDKRISLDAVAEWLEAHDWIAEARVIPLAGERRQLGAVVRLTARGERELSTLQRAVFSRHLRTHVLQRFEPTVSPRKWRFVATLPVNTMGKTAAADLEKLFERSAR